MALVKAGKLTAEMAAQLLDADASPVVGSDASGGPQVEQEPKRKRQEVSAADKVNQEDPQHDSPPRKDPKLLVTGLHTCSQVAQANKG